LLVFILGELYLIQWVELWLRFGLLEQDIEGYPWSWRLRRKRMNQVWY